MIGLDKKLIKLKEGLYKPYRGIKSIEASMTPEGFRAYLKGNIIKYLWRYEYKNGIEDLKKAQWYLARLRLLVEKQGENDAGLPTDKET